MEKYGLILLSIFIFTHFVCTTFAVKRKLKEIMGDALVKNKGRSAVAIQRIFRGYKAKRDRFLDEIARERRNAIVLRLSRHFSFKSFRVDDSDPAKRVAETIRHRNHAALVIQTWWHRIKTEYNIRQEYGSKIQINKAFVTLTEVHNRAVARVESMIRDSDEYNSPAATPVKKKKRAAKTPTKGSQDGAHGFSVLKSKGNSRPLSSQSKSTSSHRSRQSFAAPDNSMSLTPNSNRQDPAAAFTSASVPDSKAYAERRSSSTPSSDHKKKARPRTAAGNVHVAAKKQPSEVSLPQIVKHSAKPAKPKPTEAKTSAGMLERVNKRMQAAEASGKLGPSGKQFARSIRPVNQATDTKPGRSDLVDMEHRRRELKMQMEALTSSLSLSAPAPRSRGAKRTKK